MLQDEYNAIDNEICDIRNRINELGKKLKFATNEDDEIEYSFQIMKLNEQLSPLEEKHKILSEKIKKEREINEQQEKENLRKEKLYKKLYVTLDDKKLNEIKKDLNISQSSKDGIIKELMEMFSTEQEIFKVINAPKVSDKELKEIVEYIEFKYDLSFSGYDNGTLCFEKSLYPSHWSYKDMNESDYKDYEWEQDKLLDELCGDPKISNDFDFEIDMIDGIEYSDFMEGVRNARRAEMDYRIGNAVYERGKKKRDTYKKNVARYEELIAKKKAEKMSKKKLKK